jgi:hypothetical protein
MIHYIKEDMGDGSSAILYFSTYDLAIKYAEHPEREDYCQDGDGITYGWLDATPGPTFKFSDDEVKEHDEPLY